MKKLKKKISIQIHDDGRKMLEAIVKNENENFIEITTKNDLGITIVSLIKHQQQDKMRTRIIRFAAEKKI